MPESVDSAVHISASEQSIVGERVAEGIDIRQPEIWHFLYQSRTTGFLHGFIGDPVNPPHTLHWLAEEIADLDRW